MSRSIRIGIDGRVLVGTLAGTGRYVFEICRHLDRQMPESEFFVYGPSATARPADNARWHFREEPVALARKLKPVLWLKARAGTLARKDHLDVFWGGAHFLPAFLPPSTKTVLTVHDLAHRVCPETMTPPHRYAHDLFFERDCRRATKIIVNSRGTATRLQTLIRRSADAIVMPGVSESWTRRSAREVATVIEKHSLSSKFLLAVSTVEPRKNYALLVKAFVSLKRSGALPEHQLVIVGAPGWRCDDDIKLIRASHGHGVRWLGFVSDFELQCLYSGTALYVCASRYEGFGMPTLEAARLGTPSLVSDIPELREAGGEGPRYASILEETLASDILAALRDARTNLPRTVAAPTWEAGASTMRETLLSLIA
jgi:glycosyltransferase involved in cell wall biosynthesis